MVRMNIILLNKYVLKYVLNKNYKPGPIFLYWLHENARRSLAC
jgi:hypothetical protein